MAFIAGTGVGGDTNATQAIRHYAAALIQNNQYVPPAVRQQLSNAGVIGQTTPVGHIAGTLANLTGLPMLTQGAIGAVEHPINRLTSGGTMEVPWIAGRPWFHGSGSVFDSFDISKADPNALYGPAHYITDDRNIANTYASKGTGSLSHVFAEPEHAAAEAKRLTAAGNTVVRQVRTPSGKVAIQYHESTVGPNVTMYSFQPDEILDVREPLEAGDVKRVEKAILGSDGLTAKQLSELGTSMSRLMAMGAAKNGLWQEMAGIIGPARTNRILVDAGYDAIAYPGGAITKGNPHNALAVINPRALKRGGTPNARFLGTPRPTR